MYTIKQAAARSGVSVELLRAWERRYGVVHPQRTASGYRLYDDAAVSRLQAVKRLLDNGWSASNAAAAVREMADPAISELLTKPAAPRNAEGLPEIEAMVGRFLEGARHLDQAGMEAALDEVFAIGSFESVADTFLQPMMTAIGDAWVAGTVDVASEHTASHLVLRRLASAFQAAGRPHAGDRPVLVGLPPGARHELGALAFAAAVRRSGLAVVYLGSDLPTDDWVRAALESAARAAVIAVPMKADAPAAVRVAEALGAARPDLVVLFGGAAAGSASAPGVLRLSPTLTQSVDRLHEALA